MGNEILIYSVFTIVISLIMIISGYFYTNNKIKDVKIFKIDEYKTTHHIESGICSVKLKANNTEYLIEENNIIVKFLLSKIKDNEFYLVISKDKPEGFIAGGKTYQLSDSKISPINSCVFWKAMWLFLISSICASNINMDGPVSSLVFLVFGFITVVVMDFINDNKYNKHVS